MKFNNEFYNQIKSNAMVTIFTPTYATLSMDYFKIKVYSVCILKYGGLLAEHIKETRTIFCMTAIQFSEVAKLALKSYYSF